MFGKARRALTYIGRHGNPDGLAVGYYRRYENELDATGVPHAKSIEEAMNWFSAGIHAAYAELTDQLIRSLHRDGRLTFSKLNELIS